MNQQVSFFDNMEFEYHVGVWIFKTFYDERRKKWRWLWDEKETFYNAKNEMMEWDTEEEAINYLMGVYPSARMEAVG